MLEALGLRSYTYAYIPCSKGGEMTTPLRPCWRNCAVEVDAEILAIDRMEDRLAPIPAEVKKIRALISALELCHHKAERWVGNIIKAIGTGTTNKGLGTRKLVRAHPAETVWQHACAALSSWVAGSPVASIDIAIGTVPAARLLSGLGERSSLKEWQVQRVIEKIRASIHWPRSLDDSSANYVWLVLSGDEYGLSYRARCPDRYKEHEGRWRQTIKTMIHDRVDGNETELSLALAIDMLWPCHWNFVANLQIVLDAIGGKLRPEKAFAACGRNLSPLPIGQRMMLIAQTLGHFCGQVDSALEIDTGVLAQLGPPTDEKRWLASSMAKTLRLQLNPPVELRAMSMLALPEGLG